jgi:Zn-dependent M28 family amino/carboxypeptidase
VIGAHYDTVEKTNGVNDNGSGMTVLLEIIRLLHLNNCQITYSLFFIAFDLEEYVSNCQLI